ncbi:hypothetical protein LCGC14_0278670 [marine sediment metagenome]|uniref:HNH endonuclease n=1 Tax=marine sediment metagenome TaxID=412755 RepID=A0A0F9U1V1_9ZZZZ
MSKRLELTGQKFGRLTVIKFSHINENVHGCWKCKCDCGNEKIIVGFRLKSGVTKSCGCLNWDQQRLPEGVAARNRALNSHKANAKARNLDHDLTDEQILALHKENCYYCGSPPSNVQQSKNGLYTYNGIDRVDSNIGYTIGNSVPCCSNCNYSKRDRSYEEFKAWIKQTHSHLNL